MATKLKSVKRAAKVAKRFVIDAGNSDVKFVFDQVMGKFVHKVAMLMPHEYEDGMKRYGASNRLDFIRVNGSSYAVGPTADNWEVQSRTGAPKYARDYYGPLFAGAIGRAFNGRADDVNGKVLSVVASHASRDYQFHQQLRDAIEGQWDFEIGGDRYKFSVSEVLTYEEPFGSYARRAFAKKGSNWVATLHGVAAGVVDIGGGTCGVLAVDENGNVQYGMSDSGSQGMNNVIARMREILKHDFPQRFGQAMDIPTDRIRQAIKTGNYVGGGKPLEVSTQVELVLAPLLNEVKNLYSAKLNGGESIDVLILTGGGIEVLHEKVKVALGHGNTMLSDELGILQYANVVGAGQFFDVLDSVQ